MWAPYAVKVNIALAQMNIDPNTFPSIMRSEIQQKGKAQKLTPQETALSMVWIGLGINYPMDVETAIGVWRHEGKIDITKHEVADILSRLGFAI